MLFSRGLSAKDWATRRGIDGRTANTLRGRRRLRTYDGNLEPSRREYFSRLAGAAYGLAMDRYRMRQRRIQRAAGGTLRARRSAGRRPVRGAARLRAHAA